MGKKRLAVLVCAMLMGCSSPIAPDPAPWSPAYDADWSAVTACWGVVPEKPEVVVRETCREKYAAQDWEVSSGVWVHGTSSHGVVTVCPDLKGLRHEFSEHVRRYAPDGSQYTNGSGKCWM